MIIFLNSFLPLLFKIFSQNFFQVIFICFLILNLINFTNLIAFRVHIFCYYILSLFIVFLIFIHVIIFRGLIITSSNILFIICWFNLLIVRLFLLNELIHLRKNQIYFKNFLFLKSFIKDHFFTLIFIFFIIII